MRAESSSSFPLDMCGRCLGPHFGDHPRFCDDCLDLAEMAELAFGLPSDARTAGQEANDA